MPLVYPTMRSRLIVDGTTAPIIASLGRERCRLNGHANQEWMLNEVLKGSIVASVKFKEWLFPVPSNSRQLMTQQFSSEATV